MKRLNSQLDVKDVLKGFGHLTVPETVEADFLSLVWDKVASPHSPFSISKPSPAFAWSLAIAMLVISGFLAFQHFVFISEEGLPSKREIPLRGVILDARGLPNGSTLAKELNLGEPAPILKAIEEGDQMTTASDSHVTFYLPEAGYFHLAEDSSLVINMARKEWPHGKAEYEVVLEKGTLISRLEELRGGAVFRYSTPYGRARVLGTELVLNVIPPPAFGPEGLLSPKAPPSAEKAGGGMIVEVVSGVVGVQLLEQLVVFEHVERGQRAVISTAASGAIELRSIPEQRMDELASLFEKVFGGMAVGKSKEDQAAEPNFRVVTQKEE